MQVPPGVGITQPQSRVGSGDVTLGLHRVIGRGNHVSPVELLKLWPRPFFCLEAFGHGPPVGIPTAFAALHPAWSAPDCPPEIMRSTMALCPIVKPTGMLVRYQLDGMRTISSDNSEKGMHIAKHKPSIKAASRPLALTSLG